MGNRSRKCRICLSGRYVPQTLQNAILGGFFFGIVRSGGEGVLCLIRRWSQLRQRLASSAKQGEHARARKSRGRAPGCRQIVTDTSVTICLQLGCPLYFLEPSPCAAVSMLASEVAVRAGRPCGEHTALRDGWGAYLTMPPNTRPKTAPCTKDPASSQLALVQNAEFLEKGLINLCASSIMKMLVKGGAMQCIAL